MGSQPSPPRPPSPAEEARAQMQVEQSRREWESRQAEAQRQRDLIDQRRQDTIDARTRAEQEAATRRAENERIASERKDLHQRSSKGRQLIGNAADRARSTARGNLSAIDDQLARRYGLTDIFGSINSAIRGLDPAETASDPYSSLGVEDEWNRLFDTANNRYRRDLISGIDEYAAEGFERERFRDDIDDEILREILDTQKQDALDHISRASARGQLNDGGLARAQRNLDQRNEAAWGEINDLGMGVLSRYRDDLSGMRSSELDRIGKLLLTDTYDPNNFRTRLTSRMDDYGNRLRGDIFSAVGDQQFFDPTSIVGKVGSMQGNVNPTGVGTGGVGDSPLMNAFVDNEKNKRTQGTSGVF